KPKYEATEANERAPYIEILIDEGELSAQFQNNLLELFKPKELEDYGIGEERSFIEFKSFRELGLDELNQLKELGDEYFYEISRESPLHYVSGEVTFKYSDTTSKEAILDQLRSKLANDYQLETEVLNDGSIKLTEAEIPHLQKIISDNYDYLLFLNRNNTTQLRVLIRNDTALNQAKENLNSRLKELGFNSANVSIKQNTQTLIAEIPTFIYENREKVFVMTGGGNPASELSRELQLMESVSRFSSTRPFNMKPVDGLEIVGKTFQIVNATKEQINSAQTTLQQTFPAVQFRRLPTQYHLRLKPTISNEFLRDFKTKTDLQGKTEFIISSSTVKVTANDLEDFNQQLSRLQKAFPSATIEPKSFNPTFQLLFKTDIESQRQSLLNKFENEVRKEVKAIVDFQEIKNFTRLYFEFYFKTETEREQFKASVRSIATRYVGILELRLENEFGRTIYELFKNETLELEKEKEVAGNVRQATFIYLTPDQRQQLSEAIEHLGDDAFFREGLEIGRLIRKDKNRLKFQITEDFDQRLNAREEDRIDLDEIRKGYIKPIFPGELANIGRMIRAMKKVTEPGVRAGYPVNENLPNFLFDPNEARQSVFDIEYEKRKLLENLNEPLLRDQPKQIEAVIKTLTAKDLALIQGPPGTGKTTVIAEIIWQTILNEPGAKVLITSQTNLAVDNALERIKGKQSIRPIRIGNTEKFENEGKVYSNERIKKWIQSKENSKELGVYSDNAVAEWIENIKSKCSNEEKYSSAISKWREGLTEKNLFVKNTFSNAYYKHVNVFAATCSECGSKNFAETYHSLFQKNIEKPSDPEFDLVIMDEASKATPPELVLPLTLGKKVVIIGDHKQLPPMIDEKEFGEALETVDAKSLIESWEKSDYKISQFEKLFKNAPKSLVTSLDTQFRMHEQIMNCISQFYTDQKELEQGLKCGIKDEMDIPDFSVKASRWHGIKSEPFITPDKHAIWVNVETPENIVGTSFENEGEIDALLLVLRTLLNASGFEDYLCNQTKEEDKEIGVITFYSPQRQRIAKALYPHFTKNDWRNFELHKFENEFQIPFRVNTVDRFQGMERNIVIISTVRSHLQYKFEKGKRIQIDNNRYPRALGFARELQRINVGFSRAKRLLIVIGNESHFSHKPEYSEAIQKMHRVDIAQLQNLTIK
ncbi:MAG TPA: AAA domain-containing protein, partial [Cyclobacteriaceae bacterium]|nr:AAA domain-containing protein [Cyclobacteriaceae bacterium]